MFWLSLLSACREQPHQHKALTATTHTIDTTHTTDTTDTIISPPENILVLVLDDIGIDKIGAYGPTLARTPVIDGLAAEGVLFRRAYSSPLCSPTRANLLTGRYGRRTGIGDLMMWRHDPPLDPDERGLGALLDSSIWTWDRSAIGKWHIGALGDGDKQTLLDHPKTMGFPWHAGSIENIGVAVRGDPSGYDHWEKNDNGVASMRETYATIDTTNDAIERIAVMSQPWLAYVAYNAAHEPWHMPPDRLHTYDTDPVDVDSPDAKIATEYLAMVESLDTEIGRLLASMSDELRQRTTLIVMSDNGTAHQAILPPYDPTRDKASVYDGGIHVPLIVTGPRVTRPGSVSDALVHAVDVFATAADIAGVPLTGPHAPTFAGPIDGISMLPLLADPDAVGERQYVFSELFSPNGPLPEEQSKRTVHDREWKYVRSSDGSSVTEQLFRFVEGAIDEGDDLMVDGMDAEEALQHTRLSTELDRMLDDLSL